MTFLNLNELNSFVNDNIDKFHDSKLSGLKKLSLKEVLRRKNPYLFKAKNLNSTSALVEDILNAYLSSSEEKKFGDFLEELALYVANKTYSATKSSTTGLDLEFSKKGVYYLVSIKSGPSWGNSSQIRELVKNFNTAVSVKKQLNRSLNVQSVLGICYGKAKTTFRHNYMKVEGQNFWELLSGDKNFYLKIIEPLGYKAREHNENFIREKDRITNLFTQEFIQNFCTNGIIDWSKLVKFNSENL